MRMVFIVSVAFIAASCITASSPPLPQPILPAPSLSQPALPQPDPHADVQATPSALTPGMVKTRLIIGKTSQAEVLEVFGPPDHVTRSGRGEMWGYDKVSREVAMAATGARADAGTAAASAGSAGLGIGGLGLIGGAGGGVLGGVGAGTGVGIGQNVAQGTRQSTAQASQQARQVETTKTVFLLVYFDEKGTVTDYKLSATKF